MHLITRFSVIISMATASTAAWGQTAPDAQALAQQPATATAATPAAAAPVANPEAPAPAGSVQSKAAEEPKEGGEEPFGKAGVLNIASDITLNYQHTGYSAPSGQTAPSSASTYAIGPAADYFVIDNLSVGAMVLFARTQPVGSDAKVDTISLEPRIGYHIPLVPERLGVWPRVSFIYEQNTIKTPGFADSKEKSMGIGGFVPLLIHPVEHFHIGIGPYIETELSAKVDSQDAAKATTIGLRMEIAGWWKL